MVTVDYVTLFAVLPFLVFFLSTEVCGFPWTNSENFVE